MTPDGRIDAHRGGLVAKIPFQLRQLLVQLLAHAVQALELELASTGERLHLADRIGVVRRERGIDRIRRSQQLLRAGEI